MGDDYSTNSCYLTYSFSLKGWANVLFELRTDRVNVAFVFQVKGDFLTKPYKELS